MNADEAASARRWPRTSWRDPSGTLAPVDCPEFPAGIAQGELPPLFVLGSGGSGELVNYRVRDRYMVVDRLFQAGELRLGDRKSERKVRIVREDGRTARKAQR